MQERGVAAALTGRGARTRLRRPQLLMAAVAGAVLLADQLTKTWALAALDDGDIDLVWTLRLHLTFNSGGAFSLAEGNPWFFVVAGAVLLAILLGFGRRLTATLPAVSLGLVVGGALGNLGDRLFRDHDGAVVDFVDLQWWPVFNLADAAIVCGAALMVVAGRRAAPEEDGPGP